MGFTGSNFNLMRDEKLNPRGSDAVSRENPGDWQVRFASLSIRVCGRTTEPACITGTYSRLTIMP